MAGSGDCGLRGILRASVASPPISGELAVGPLVGESQRARSLCFMVEKCSLALSLTAQATKAALMNRFTDSTMFLRKDAARNWCRGLARWMRLALAGLLALVSTVAYALDLETPFESIDGGTLSLAQWSGQPVLVVNTASMCAFTEQYKDLQALYDQYRDQGLIVLAVPSDDFNQELDDNAAVKDFCELVYGIDMPMTVITSVKGRAAHPFYQSLRMEEGFTPRWNFSKVLLDREGALITTFGSRTSPLSPEIVGQVEAALNAAPES